MKKWLFRSALALLTVLVVAALVHHLGLRNWCLRWGTTARRSPCQLPGDDLFPAYSGEATPAITIHPLRSRYGHG